MTLRTSFSIRDLGPGAVLLPAPDEFSECVVADSGPG